MNLQELTTRLQTLCHEGWATHEVGVKVLDTYYKTGDILKLTTGSGDDTGKVYFVIDTEVK